MASVCCKNGWYKGSKEITGRPPTPKKEEGGRLTHIKVDNVESDLRNMGVKSWKTRALDRTEWASVSRVHTQTIITDFKM